MNIPLHARTRHVIRVGRWGLWGPGCVVGCVCRGSVVVGGIGSRRGREEFFTKPTDTVSFTLLCFDSGAWKRVKVKSARFDKRSFHTTKIDHKRKMRLERVVSDNFAPPHQRALSNRRLPRDRCGLNGSTGKIIIMPTLKYHKHRSVHLDRQSPATLPWPKCPASRGAIWRHSIGYKSC